MRTHSCAHRKTKRKLVDDKIGHNQLLLRALTRVNSDEIGLPTVPPFPKFVSSPVKLKRRKMILPVLSVFCHCGSSNAQGDDMFSCVTGAIPSLRLLLHNWWKSPLAKQMEGDAKTFSQFDGRNVLIVKFSCSLHDPHPRNIIGTPNISNVERSPGQRRQEKRQTEREREREREREIEDPSMTCVWST